MNATIESSRSDASGGLDLQLVSAVCGLTIAFSIAFLSGAWSSPATKHQPPRRPLLVAGYRQYTTTTTRMPSSTMYIVRSDDEALALRDSIYYAELGADTPGQQMMDYSILVARSPQDDFEIERLMYERSIEYGENGQQLHIVDMRPPRD